MSTIKKSKSSSSSKVKSGTGNTIKPSKPTTTTTTTEMDARYEGTNTNWDYTPPPGAVLIKEDTGTGGDVDCGEFDWDRVCEDDELELWVVRVPEAIKPKHLENLSLSLASSSKKSCRIGSVKRKTTTFDIWSIGEDEDADEEGGNGGVEKEKGSKDNKGSKGGNGGKEGGQDKVPVGGEELKGLACLLPRKSKKGKLYPAPKPFTRHIVIAAQPIQPSVTDDSSATTSTTATANATANTTITGEYKNPPRFSYPKEVLKHRYIPYGSTELLGSCDANGGGEKERMDVDGNDGEVGGEVEAVEVEVRSPKKAKREEKVKVKEVKEKETKDDKEKEKEKDKSKGKKRKGDVGGDESVPAKKAKKSK